MFRIRYRIRAANAILRPLFCLFFRPTSAVLSNPLRVRPRSHLRSLSGGWPISFWINDAHAPLIALWREIVAHPEELADRYSRLWRAQLGREREYYDFVRKKFNETRKPEYFLYLLARCVKAAIRYNQEGDFNNSPDNRRKARHPSTMRERIKGASAYCKSGRS